MSLKDYKITQGDIETKGVVAAPDVMSGDPQANKRIFDRLIREAVAEKVNGLVDALLSSGVEVILKRGDDSIQYIRINADNVLEVSTDGKEYFSTVGSGHIIVDKYGKDVPKGLRLQFDNFEVREEDGTIIVHGVAEEIAGAIPSSDKGAPNGVAELDETGKVPEAQLPEKMTPAAHADTHKRGGSDPLTAANIGAVPEKRAQTTLESVGWYRIARFVGTAAASQSIVMLGTSYSNSPPFGLVALVSANNYRSRITILQASAAVYFTELRLVKAGTNEMYLEAYYSAGGRNPVAATLYNGYVTYNTYPVEFVASTASAEDVVLTQAVRSIPSGNVLTDGSHRFAVLWENASPTSEFKEQDISIDSSGYSHVFVEALSANGSHTISVFAPVGTTGCIQDSRTVNNSAARIAMRQFVISEDKVHFNNCTDQNTTETTRETANNLNVPIKVYGFKGVYNT